MTYPLCDNPDLNISGDTCKRLGIGQPCNATNQCASLICKAGARVPATTETVYCLAD